MKTDTSIKKKHKDSVQGDNFVKKKDVKHFIKCIVTTKEKNEDKKCIVHDEKT